MQHKAEIVYQSPETTPDGNSFMTVKKSRGYYYYAERGGVDSIFFVLYDAHNCKFALIHESKPPRDETCSEEVSMATAFGGSIDSADELNGIVQTEVLEEAGYNVPLDCIRKVGTTMVSTQMSQMAHGYIVNVTYETKTHETEYEALGKGNRTRWMTMDEVISNSDWKSMFIILKAQAEGLL